jgi:uncharacterized protein YaaR (DUF327 family)
MEKKWEEMSADEKQEAQFQKLLSPKDHEGNDLRFKSPEADKLYKFVDTIKEIGSNIVRLSSFLTLAFDSMKEMVDAIKQAGLRDEIKTTIGGCQIDDDLWACTSLTLM